MQPVENLCRICTRDEEGRSFVCIFNTKLELEKGAGMDPERRDESEPESVPLVRTVAEVMAGCLDIEVGI